MNKPTSRSRTALALLTASLAAVPATSHGLQHAHVPFIHESYDKNPLGDMIGTQTGGYGVFGTYTAINGTTANMFKIVDTGLDFPPLGSAVGRSIQLTGNATPRGVSIAIDGGQARGDLDAFINDKLYVSYLVNYAKASSSTSGRGELRVVNGSTNIEGTTSTYQIHSDQAGSANLIQPALSYTGTTYNTAPTDQALAKEKTYLMIGKFDQVGNLKSFSTTATLVATESTITVASSSSMALGNLITGTGIQSDTIITAINSSTSISLSKPIVTAGTGVSVTARRVVQKSFVEFANYAVATTPNTLTNITKPAPPAPPSQIAMGQYVVGPGIPAGTRVTQILASPPNNPDIFSIRISSNVTADSGGLGKPLRFTDIAPVTASWNAATNPNQLTLSVAAPMDHGIAVGQTVIATGIADTAAVTPTVVTAISGNTVTLSAPLTGTGSGVIVYFLPLTGHSSLYALTLEQYNNMMTKVTSLSTREAEINEHLNTAAIGGLATQITTRIQGTPKISGSPEFGHGTLIQIVVGGADNNYQMDELRYGATATSVVVPTAYETDPTPTTLEVVDRFNNVHSSATDTGYGWKSGYYVVEETRSPQGATVNTDISTLPLVPTPGGPNGVGSNPSLSVATRSAVTADQGIRRRPDPAVVDMRQPYTVEFDFRVNAGLDTFTNYNDRVHIAADVNGTGLGTNANNSWLVGVVGANNGSSPFAAGKWYFYDNKADDAAFVLANMQVSPINLTPGRTYRFKIEADAPARRYHAKITALATTSSPEQTFEARNMYCRGDVDATTLLFATVKNGEEERSFSLDNLVMTQGISDPDDYPEWIAAATEITVAGDKIRTADPDKDGRPNFLEFALNSSASKGSGSGSEYATITNTDGVKYHTMTIPVRAGITFRNTGTGPNVSVNSRSGLRYTIQGSYDMNFTSGTLPTVFAYRRPQMPASPELPALPGGWEYKTFRLPDPITSHPKGFLRVVVESTQPVAP